MELAFSLLIPPRLFWHCRGGVFCWKREIPIKEVMIWSVRPNGTISSSVYSFYCLLSTMDLSTFTLLQPCTVKGMRNTTAALLCPTMHIHVSFQACRVSFHPIGFVYPFVWLSVISVHPWESGQALNLFWSCRWEELSYSRDYSVLLWEKAVSQLHCHPTSGNIFIKNSTCSL